MKNYEEEQLEKMRKQLEKQPIPHNSLDEAILAGFNKARSKRKKRKRSIWLSVAAAIFLIGFVTSVRVSPAFANAVASIPGFHALVEMIQWDKGLQDIVENEYYEELNIEVIEDDITLTLLGVIADETGMIISYRVEAPFDLQEIDTKNITIHQNGKELEAAYSYNWFLDEPANQLEDQVEITAARPLNYESPNFEVQFVLNNFEQTKFNIPFTLKKEIKRSVTYPIEQIIDIDGQKLTVHELTISPLRAGITLSINEENSMQLLTVESIQLIDENGEEWGSILNGISGFGSNYDTMRTVFIQSNYFRKPKQLYLKIDRIQALPKGENYIELDFSKKEVIHQPADLPIQISDIDNNSFTATIPNSSETFHHEIFLEAFDANGKSLNFSSHSMFRDDHYMTFQPRLEIQEMANPVKMFIHSFPNYLEGNASLKINLK